MGNKILTVRKKLIQACKLRFKALDWFYSIQKQPKPSKRPNRSLIDLIELTETNWKELGTENIAEYFHVFTGVSKAGKTARGVSVRIKKTWKIKWTTEKLIIIDQNILITVAIISPSLQATHLHRMRGWRKGRFYSPVGRRLDHLQTGELILTTSKKRSICLHIDSPMMEICGQWSKNSTISRIRITKWKKFNIYETMIKPSIRRRNFNCRQTNKK